MNPRGMYDMTGWTEIDCAASNDLRDRNRVTVASSLTDPSAIYSSGVIFTEWWTDLPVLRDYLYPDERPCRHFEAINPLAATAEGDA